MSLERPRGQEVRAFRVLLAKLNVDKFQAVCLLSRHPHLARFVRVQTW
jgi:hypothetical protein